MLPVPLTSPLKNAVAGDGGLQPPRACRITHGQYRLREGDSLEFLRHGLPGR